MHVRNALNIAKAVSAIHMRNAANLLKTVPTAHMRNAANVLKIAYTAPGGGGGGADVTVTPASKLTSSSTSSSNTSDFTAAFDGGAPSSIVWSLSGISGGTATIVSGQGTATGRIKLTNTGGAGTTAQCTVKCTAVIGGVSVFDTSIKKHTISAGDGGGGSGGGGTVSISDQTIERDGFANANASYILNVDGNAYGPQSINLLEAWLDSGVATDFEVRATLLSGAISSGTMGSWLNLGTSRTWTVSQFGAGTSTSSIKVEIRDASTLIVLDTATINLIASAAGTGGTS